ncbi:transposable element Tcb2 transposase [Trichonephila clavipes]|nr:transposable element Tcb2 transposase [Trichonephila clavipes]
MEWPACSPDMNPIEHVWDALGRRVAGHQPPPQTLQEWERALLEEWDRIPQLVINSLIDSMPQRSPDHSPIEHIWGVMERRLQPFRNVDDLSQQLERIWHEIPQETIRKLSQSVP